MQKFIELTLCTSLMGLLSACGGGDSDNPPASLSAANCFDIATYTSGSAILQGTEEPSSNNDWSAQSINIAAVLKDQQTRFSILRAVNSYLLPTRSSREGYILDNKTVTTEIFYASGTGFRQASAHTVYDPPIEDKRFTLKQGESTSYSTMVTHTITSLLNPTPSVTVSKLSENITFEGKDQISIGTRMVEACRFSNGYSLEWFYRGISVQSAQLDGTITRRTTGITRDGQIY